MLNKMFSVYYMKIYSLVLLGGGIGALCRYIMQGLVYNNVNSSIPYGTMAVNITGCLIIGFLMSFFEYKFSAVPELRIFLTTGFLGGFTTYSSFSYESVLLLKEGDFFHGLLYIAGTTLLCLLSTYGGLKLGKLL
jgi:CrcB protein